MGPAPGGRVPPPRHPPPPNRAPARRSEIPRRPAPELEPVLVEWSQVREIAERPLEVVTQDLLEFRLAIVFPVCAFCPVREALVQARSFPLQQPLICRVADEDVLEAVHACLSRARTYELRGDERCEVE